MVAFSLHGFFRKREKQYKNICYKVLAIISFPLRQSNCFSFYFNFRSFCLTPFTQMPSLNRYKKVTCENCGTQSTKLNLAHHKEKGSLGTLYCTQCPNFPTNSQADLNYHIVKIHATARVKSTQMCKICFKEFSGFYALR